MAISHKDLKSDSQAFYNEPPVGTQKDEKAQARSNNVSHKIVARVLHDPTLEGEAMPVCLGDPDQIILGYLYGDVITQWPGDEKTKGFSFKERQQFKLFGRTVQDLICPRAATLILHGEGKEVEEAFALVKAYPDILRYSVIAKDRLGRMVQGTPLQIAAMAGDVDLKAGITEEKDRGAVERLISAGNLSEEEVAQQLKVITSKEAQAENEKRNQRVLSAIKKFGETLIEMKDDEEMSFKVFQTRCQGLIDQLKKDLTPDPKEVITSGYIFDPKILQDAAEWFEQNVNRFGGLYSLATEVWWINGFGKLESKCSSRDAQLVKEGVGNWAEGGNMPPRSLNNSDGVSYFFNSSSRLGVDFYLGYYHRLCYACPDNMRSTYAEIGVRLCFRVAGLENLRQAKTLALQNLCNIRTTQNRASV